MSRYLLYSILTILLLIVFGFILFKLYERYTLWQYYRGFRPNPDVPKLIHLIYIPWDKHQRLKPNVLDFSHAFYHKMVATHPDFHVEMWTLPKLKHFVTTYYPMYEEVIFNLPRPTMMVDFLRTLVVYHYGGIYWQYESESKCDLNYFLPGEEYHVKLFTETILSARKCQEMANEPIRQGIPEEAVRVFSGFFSAVPRHPYLWELFQRAVYNMRQIGGIQRDYDILYICANAMMSERYDKIGQYQKDIELVPHHITKCMISLTSKGSWRTDKKK